MQIRPICFLAAFLTFGPPVLSTYGALSDFQVFNYYFNGNTTTPALPGRLFVPAIHDPASPSYNPGAPSLPIVLFFHGMGERGTDNTLQVNGNIDHLLAAAKSRGFYIYAPQAPTTSTYWTSSTVDNALRQLESAPAQFKIDKSRIHVTGLSMGGSGVWNTLSRYPGGFAAGVSICGTDAIPSVVFANVAGKPIWQFHAGNDTGPYPAKSRDRVNGIRNALGLSSLTWPPVYTNGSYLYSDSNTPQIDKQRYTEYQTGGHGIWGTVYSTPALYDWWVGINGNPAFPGQSQALENASLRVGEKILIDLGNTTKASDVTGQTWNTTAYGYHNTLAGVLPFMRTAAGRMTTVSLALTQAFAGHSGDGSTALFESGIGTDGWFGNGKLMLHGLVPGAIYRLELYGSSATAGRLTRYQVGTQSIDLNATSNATSTAVLSSITADARGRIELSVGPSGSGVAGQINAIDLQLVSLPVIELPFFEQNFNSPGLDYTAYFQANPLTANLFSDIGGDSMAGGWSMEDGWLKLNRTGMSAAGSGITRLSVPASEAPNVMECNFKLKVSCNTWNELFHIDLGNFTQVTDYSNWSIAAGVANRLFVRAAGNGIVKFQLNTVTSAGFTAGPSNVLAVSWMLNQSGVDRTYSLGGISSSLSSGCSDLWVNGVKIISNLPREAGLGGTHFSGIRLHTTINSAVTLSFDDFLLYGSLPE